MMKNSRRAVVRMAVAGLFLSLLAAPAWAGPYIDLNTGGLSLGAKLGSLDLGIGVGVSADQYHNYDTDTTEADTTYRSSSKRLSWGPSVNIGYYLGSGALRPFINLGGSLYLSGSGGAWRYQDDTLDQTSKYTYWSASGSLMGGVEYFVDRISIGAGIGPSVYMSRSTSRYPSYHYLSSSRGVWLGTILRFRYYF